MAAIKDPALAALKRAARAILKDELKALKQAVKDARQEQKEAVDTMQVELNAARLRNAEALRQRDEERARISYLKGQVAKVRMWQRKFAPVDKPFEIALDYLDRPKPTGSWSMTGCVCPFSRWGYTSPDELK